MFYETFKIFVDFFVLACLNLMIHRVSSIFGLLCFLSLFIMFGIAKSFVAASVVLLVSIFCGFCWIGYLMDYCKKYDKIVVFFWPVIALALYGQIRPML